VNRLLELPERDLAPRELMAGPVMRVIPGRGMGEAMYGQIRTEFGQQVICEVNHEMRPAKRAESIEAGIDSSGRLPGSPVKNHEPTHVWRCRSEFVGMCIRSEMHCFGVAKCRKASTYVKT